VDERLARNDAKSLTNSAGNWTAVASRAADRYIARMTPKRKRARLTSDAALLLSHVIALLVCHVSGDADKVDGAIAFPSRASAGLTIPRRQGTNPERPRC
jgi:hypothetical protein